MPFPMAGHSGTAYWFSKASGEFITSTYYLDEYPSWVTAFNESRPTAAYSNTSWSLLRSRGDYRFGDSDDVEWELDVPVIGRVFPHSFGDESSPYFTTWLTLSPVGDRLVLDFAKHALVNESLGKR